MEKKVAGFWVKVPCVDNVGSCTYSPTCAQFIDLCQKYLVKYSIPCVCPFPAGTYAINDAVFDITGHLPPGASGEFRITADIHASSGHIGCLHVDADLK